MNISIDWIREFVDLPTEVNDELGKKFTLATCEVEGVEKINSHFTKVVVAEIIEINPHPQADKLNLVTINKGNGETQVVVCGAPNVEVGKKIPFAPVGTTLPGNFTLTPKEIRGVMSEGMLCGETELELGSDDYGLLIFDADAPVGTTLAEYLDMPEDIIFDIDNKSITHRPDLWAQYGMAREFATVFKKDLKAPFNSDWSKKIEKLIPSTEAPINVTVSEDSACTGYFGISINNVAVTESPTWVKKRLVSCGIRPINNMVDISNYVMLELGIPNHIFDSSKISENIVVRKAEADQVFTTLDDVERKLVATDTVICDANGPLVIAGVMGGASSSVSDDTTSIFVEVANFKAAQVRKTSTRLGLRTDSSLRYEKTLDTQMIKRSMYRIIELILEICPGAKVEGKLSYDGQDLSAFKPLELEITCEKIRKVLGHHVDDAEIVDILERLDFKITNKKGNLEIVVPSYRSTKDIDCDADIIEEIGRVVGYDNIKPVSPLNEISAVRLSNVKSLHRKIQDFLVMNTKCLEVLTYPMIGEKLLKKAKWPLLNEELKLINAITKDNDRMRPSLIPTAIEAASVNCKNYSDFKFFELGRSYLPDAKNFRDERSQLVIGFYSKKESQMLEMINTVEKLLSYTSIPAQVKYVGGKSSVLPKEWAGIHPYENVDIKIMGRECGSIFSVHPTVCSDFKIKGHLTLAVIDLTDVETKALKDKNKYNPLPKFPGSIFDCSVVTNKETEVVKVLEALKKVKYKELESIKIVDIFKIDDETKSVTLRSTFIDPNKTLDGEFLTSAKQKIVTELEAAGFPLKQ